MLGVVQLGIRLMGDAMRRPSLSMIARITILAPALLLTGGPRSSTLLPVMSEMVTMTSEPVLLQADAPDRRRAGQLVWLAGWKLDAPRSRQFGGWSALRVDGDRFTAIGDYGSVLRFRLTRFGRAVEARIDPLPIGCGKPDEKRERDSEALARAPGGGWWIGYEFDNRLCRVTADFTRVSALRRPPAMARWRDVYGAETMLGLRDGRYLVIAERGDTDGAARPLLMFGGDPADPGTPVVTRSYVPPTGYSPADAAELPDGRILILNRRFDFASLFTAVLVIVDPAVFDRGAPVSGTVIAQLAQPTLHDNFEGLDVTQEGDRTIVWLLSDDNFMGWQGTYLLKFALDPQVLPPAAVR